MPEKGAGFVDTALAHQPADAGAADHEVLVADRIDLLGLEPVARAQRAQHREVAGAIVPEQEVGPHPHFSDPHPVHQHAADERFGIPLRHLVRKAHDRRTLDAGPRDRLEPLGGRHQERRRFVGPDDARRMRIEGHHGWGGTALVRDAADAVQDLPVAAMHAVEVAERQHRMTPACRARIVRKVNDLH